MKVALLIAGQMRGFDKCIDSIKKHIISQYAVCDVYVCTQDCNCIKPRLGTGKINQYIINKINYDVRKVLHDAFGDNLKGVVVRETFQSLVDQQGSDLISNGPVAGWAETFCDFAESIKMALESGVVYDLYVRIRPDVYCFSPLNIDCVVPNTVYMFSEMIGRPMIYDTYFAVSSDVIPLFVNLYDYYNERVQFDKKCVWMKNNNAEVVVEEFLKEHSINIKCIGWKGCVLGWLISECKTGNTCHLVRLPAEDRAKVMDFAAKCTTCVFDIGE